MMTVVIPRNRRRTLISLILSVLLTGFGAWVAASPLAEFGFKGLVVGWVATPFFAFAAVFSFRRLVSREPALVIDSAGLTDNISSLSAGFLPWAEIAGAVIVTSQDHKFLDIALRNPKPYVERASGLNRLFINKAAGPAALRIAQMSLPVPVEEVLGHISIFRQVAEETQNA